MDANAPRIRTAVCSPGTDPAYDLRGPTIWWEEDPSRTRIVRRCCKVCDRQWPIDITEPQVVSASGVAHHAEGDTTLCGKRATSNDWWWSL